MNEDTELSYLMLLVDNNDDELEKYRTSIRGMTRWKENWEECARHLIVGDWNK